MPPQWLISAPFDSTYNEPCRGMSLEMITMVLDNIAEQRENPEYLSTLAALCLVSKSICAQAQPRLYHKIPFLESYVSPDVLLSRVPLGRRNGRHKIPRSLLLLYTFFSNPKLTAYVTSYTIQRLSYLGDPTGNITFEVYYSALSAVLSHMPNLRELTITTDDFTRLSTDDLFTNFDYYASLMGFHKAFINRAQKPDQIVLCCGPTAKYDEGVEKNMMAMFHPFMKRALEKISSGLIKLTIQDSFTPSGYLDPNTILAKHPTLQSLIVKDQDAFPFARYTMAEIIPPQLPDSICPNLNKFEGTLQDFFRFMPSQRNLKDVRITQTDCDMGRGRDAGQRMRFQTMRLNQDGARKGDLSGVVSPIGLRTIERLEFSDHVAQDFVFTDCVGSNEVWADGIFSNLVSLHTLVLPASFSNREEEVNELSKLPNLTHIIIGATNNPSEFCDCLQLGHQNVSWPWCDVSDQTPGTSQTRDELISSLFNKCPKLQTLEIQLYFKYLDNPLRPVGRCCRLNWVQAGRLVYVAGVLQTGIY